MVGIGVMLCVLVMGVGRGVCITVSRRPTRAMHGTRYDRNGRAAQRRDPWREESRDKRNGDQTAHHDSQIYSPRLKAKYQSGIQ